MFYFLLLLNWRLYFDVKFNFKFLWTILTTLPIIIFIFTFLKRISTYDLRTKYGLESFGRN